MGDGVVAVNAEGDEDVGGGVGDNALHEFDEFAENEARIPRDGDAPNDVGLNLDETHTEVSCGQILDEEIHSGLVAFGEEQGAQHRGVPHHDEDEDDP